MILALVALAAVVLFVLAGLDVTGRRFVPQWYAAACVTVLIAAPVLQRLAQ